MYRYLLYLLLCLPGVLFAQADNTRSVLYGEHGGLPDLPSTHRVFLDRNGDLYPALLLPDSLLATADASLARLYALRPDLFSTQQLTFAAYQDSLRQANLVSLNAAAKAATDVFVLVHGFRKPFRPTPGGRTATSEYVQMQQRIRNTAPAGARPLFLEVYWDGTYDCCFGFKARKNRAIFELFKRQGQANATTTGYRLRPLLAGIETNRLHLIGHSLGTRLLLTATFDAYPDEVSPTLLKLPTPKQPLINLCLVAPAIAGDGFEHYYRRGDKQLVGPDNYLLTVFFNPRDFVLRKRFLIFGPGPRKFGDTSLGADRRNSIGLLADLFRSRFPGSPISLREADIGLSHALRDYGGTAAFRGWLEGLW